MAWKTIKTINYAAAYSYSNLSVTIQYNSTNTASEMKIRLLTTYTGGSTDGYYILWKPGQSGEELFTAKAAKDTAAATNKVVLEKTITKSYTASTFAIPEFWICNTGSTAPDLTSRKITYGDVGTVTMFWVFSLGNNRGGTNETNGMVTRVYGSSTSTSISKKATNGSVSKPSIKQDAGKNTFTISGTITEGTYNALESATLYYTTDGSTPTTSSSKKTISAAGDYSFTINVPSNKSSSIVKAYVQCDFVYNAVFATATDKTVYYYTNGSTPTLAITDNGNNTFTIAGKLGSNGWNNGLSIATLYYTTNGQVPDDTKAYTTQVDLTGHGSGGSYSREFDIPNGCTTIYAVVICTFALNQTNSGNISTPVKFYTAIGRPSVSITDNYNNTFTITGTDAANGSNNTATTTYQWDYSTNYGNSGLGVKALTIATPSDATRTVYAKATASPSWSCDSAKTATASLAIRQYVAPSAPGKPVISYSKNRLTIKEGWTYTWSAATQANSTSPVVGYRIRLYKNGSLVMGLSGSTSNNALTIANTGLDYFDRENTSCTVTIDPIAFGFKPGDTIQLGIFSYTRNGVGTQIFNGGGTSEAHVFSAVSTVQNAGVMYVKPAGSWLEGQVYVKVNGSWLEAETVSTKVNGNWYESQ